ncbi:MAG: carboxypeptidase-like regulatory domain-containing protein [Pyrinomonadaceae bacterium]
MKRHTILLISLFLLTVDAFGQSTNGTVRGRAADLAGAVVVSAEVTATSADGVQRKAKTNQAGEFNLSIAPGRYTIRVASAGFALYENTEVNVVAGRSVSLDVTLNVAQAEAEVTIGEEAPVNTNPESNASALVLNEKDIEALPDNSEDLDAALQSAGWTRSRTKRW